MSLWPPSEADTRERRRKRATDQPPSVCKHGVCPLMDWLKSLDPPALTALATFTAAASYVVYKRVAIPGTVVETERNGGELVARVFQAAGAAASPPWPARPCPACCIMLTVSACVSARRRPVCVHPGWCVAPAASVLPLARPHPLGAPLSPPPAPARPHFCAGGHISPILVASKALGMRVIDVRHEATAVFAADAVGRLTGIPGVACVTAGPGLTNTITAVKNAQMAESPLVLIAGAAATVLKGRGALQVCAVCV